jgi:alpha,alpha-trehalase
MRLLVAFAAVLVAGGRVAATPVLPPSPDVVYGALFADVQRARVFPDQKTFADCVPREEPARIVAAYAAAKAAAGGGVDLREFVGRHFLVPEVHAVELPRGANLEQHLGALWEALRRAPDRAVEGSSLLPLPEPYVVPGGRFREVYYWDSYFTMLGLSASGRDDLVESIVRNFAYELKTFGLIPNGNRTYYLSRSQPPFFALMVELLARRKGEAVYREYRPALKAEHAYWMDETHPTRHVVPLDDGALLNRYYDREARPRPESFVQDETVAHRVQRAAPDVWRDLRSAAESGWDFSSRWFGDGQRLETITTTTIVPVDLNALLWQLERTLAHAYAADGQSAKAAAMETAAARRRGAVMARCWSESEGWFCDFDLKRGERSPRLSLAGIVPLFVGLATPEQATAAAATLRGRFLRPGGVVTSLVRTGEQWDAPNGWAPLQWMAVRGLENSGQHELALEIARRWLALNRRVYAETGKMMEKYDVEDTARAAGGGEYPSQDGFGWTNGVFLALEQLYPELTATAAAAPHG